MTDPRLEAQIQDLIGSVDTALKDLRKFQQQAHKQNLTLSEYIRKVLPVSAPVQIKVLSEAMQLMDFDPVIVAVDPGGASRTVITPPPGPENHLYIILNLADAAEELNVQDVNAGRIVDIPEGGIGILVSDGDDELGSGWTSIDAVSLGVAEMANLDGLAYGKPDLTIVSDQLQFFFTLPVLLFCT